MELLNGRPADEAGRLEKEIRVYDLLDSLGISYQRVDHEPAMTIEACQDIDKLMGTHMCKNLFLCNRQETAFYLLLMPGDKKFKTKELLLRSILHVFHFCEWSTHGRITGHHTGIRKCYGTDE